MMPFWLTPAARSSRVGAIIPCGLAGAAEFRAGAAEGRRGSVGQSPAVGRGPWLTVAVAMLTFFALFGGADAPSARWFGPRQVAASLDETLDAVCRITAPDGSRGTGCAFEHSGGRVYVLTAAHVVGGAEAVWCEFWTQGRPGTPVPGKVAAVDRGADAAVVAVEESSFAGGLPRIIAPGWPDAPPSAGAAITSAGCAAGGWPTAFKGVVVELLPGELCFVPPPANGRSGSPLLDAEGRAILGVIRARTADNTTGIATPIARVFQAFSGRKGHEAQLLSEGSEPGRQWSGLCAEPRRFACSLLPHPSENPLPLAAGILAACTSSSELAAQCPGGSCPGPALFPFGRATPPREEAPRREAVPLPEVFGSRGPSLPLGRTPNAPSPAVPQPQLRRNGSPADPNREWLGGGKSSPASPSNREAQRDDSPSNPPADSTGKSSDTLPNDRTLLARELLRLLLGDPETLLDRAAARAERLRQQLGDDASAAEFARGYARDAAAEKLADGQLGWTAGKMLAAALGLSGPLSLALAGGLWLVSRRVARRIEQSEPLIVERLWRRISERIGERISDRWGGPKEESQTEQLRAGESSSSLSGEARHAAG